MNGSEQLSWLLKSGKESREGRARSPLPSRPGPDSLCRERVDGAGDEHEPGQEQLVLGPGHSGGCRERETGARPPRSLEVVAPNLVTPGSGGECFRAGSHMT